MSRWSESRQLPRNFLVTSWRLPRNICYGEVTGKLQVPVELELYWWFEQILPLPASFIVDICAGRCLQFSRVGYTKCGQVIAILGHLQVCYRYLICCSVYTLGSIKSQILHVLTPVKIRGRISEITNSIFSQLMYAYFRVLIHSPVSKPKRFKGHWG